MAENMNKFELNADMLASLTVKLYTERRRLEKIL